jgi:hypothetical protein
MSRERGSSGDLPRGRAQTRPEVVCRRRSAPQPPRGPPPTRPPAETRPGPLLGPSVPSFADGRPPRPPRGHAHGRSWVPALWSRLWVPALRPHTGGDPPQGAATTASRPRRKRKRGGGDLDTGGGEQLRCPQRWPVPGGEPQRANAWRDLRRGGNVR